MKRNEYKKILYNCCLNFTNYFVAKSMSKICKRNKQLTLDFKMQTRAPNLRAFSYHNVRFSNARP